MSPAPAPGGRLLVVAPNWLGDLVMATPLLETLARGDLGPCAVTLAVRRRWLPLFAGDPRLARLLPYERSGRHRGAAGLARLAAQWRSAGAEAALLLPPSLRVALAAALAGIPRRLGYRGDGRGLLLTRALPASPRGSRWYGEEALALGQAWAEESGHAPAAAPLPLPRLPAAERIAPLDPGSGPELWLLAPGSTYGPAKTWPAERAAAFLDLVAGEGKRAALLGDASDRPLAAAIRARSASAWREELPGAAGVVDLTGRTDLPGLVALLRAARLVVGADSGPMHLAAALGRPTLGLFGSTSPAWTAPRGPRAAVCLVEGFPCQPCFRRRCNQEVFCLRTLTAERVREEAGRLLAAPAGGAA